MRAVDVIVVGSGAGGSPVAYALAAAGAEVLVLERGPRYTRKDFVHDEVRIARRDFFVPSAQTDPHVVAAKGRAPERTNEGWVASCVGGGTAHMSGFFYRFAPMDFKVRDHIGPLSGAQHANWPIGYADLAPYYEKVEKHVGVSGPAKLGRGAAKDAGGFPFDPVITHKAASLIDGACERLGVESFVTPRAIITQPVGRRGTCTYCHLCGSFGCETGAKSSTLESLLPMAEATGRCQILPETMVQRLVVDADGRARGVEIREPSGQVREISARVVVVACSAIESVRLLLMSTTARFNEGLGNGRGQLGKHLMFSTLSKAHGSFHFGQPERDELLKDTMPFLGRSVLDYYDGDQGAGVRKGGALNFLFPSGGPIFQAEQVAVGDGELAFGLDLKRRLETYWRDQKQFDCETFGEYLPTPGTHVSLDREVTCQFGLPAARMTIDRHPHDAHVSKHLAGKAAAILEEAGADRVWTSNIGGRTMHLPMGGARMGEDPAKSVVTPECRVHDSPNVFVTDGSVFPSSGGVPPTFTILANAWRVGEHLAAELERGAL